MGEEVHRGGEAVQNTVWVGDTDVSDSGGRTTLVSEGGGQCGHHGG